RRPGRRGGRRRDRPGPAPGAVPLRPAGDGRALVRRRRRAGRGDGPARPGALRQLRVLAAGGGQPGRGVRGVRQRVRAPGRDGGGGRLRLRSALRGAGGGAAGRTAAAGAVRRRAAGCRAASRGGGRVTRPRLTVPADTDLGAAADLDDRDDPHDPFGTAAIRRRVLAGWAAAPARFREDASAEEDLACGAYRDRLVVELAQNAADAATRAGVPGVLRLSLAGGELRAANTGAPLTAPGVQALATLRASAKRGSGSVGRFGVGFAAAVAVCDEPAMLSVSGGVRFSAAGTRAAAAGLPALAGELARPGGQVPVLRLPWPDPRRPPEGFTTEVRLPLRDPVAGPALLAAVPADLLLALPGLARIELPDRELSRVDDGPDAVLHDGPTATRWRLVRRAGRLAPELLADRPVEERERPEWTVTWAVPVAPDG